MSDNNSGGNGAALLFKVITTVAVVALIVSVGRLFLDNTGRMYSTGDYYFDYVLGNAPGLSAFIATIVLAGLSILAGTYASKRYDVIGTPLKYGGLISLILVTALTYLTNKYSYTVSLNSQTNTMGSAPSIVLTLVIFFEWIALIVYSWRAEEKATNNPSVGPEPQQPMPPTPTVSPGQINGN